MTALLPGDKSISHRALLLGALVAEGATVRGAGAAEDVLATVSCLRQLGVQVRTQGDEVHLLRPPRWPNVAPVLDARNSGTTARLLLGWLCGQQRAGTVVGDASLSARPMRRVAAPLEQLFAGPVVTTCAAGTLPAEVTPRPFPALSPRSITLEVASAQVKSALLLAALPMPGELRLEVPAQTRDHTERMLRGLGADLAQEGGVLVLRGPTTLRESFSFEVPRDPSAAALLVVATLARGRSFSAGGVGLNPTRLGFLDVLRRMGAQVETEITAHHLGEPVGHLSVAPPARGPLRAVTTSEMEAAALIDEFPALLLLAAIADGASHFAGLAELRVKESDRLSSLVRNLCRLGGAATIEGDNATVVGRRERLVGGEVDALGDHRVEMAFQALYAGLGVPLPRPARSNAAVSFPGFYEALSAVLGA